MLTTFLSLVAVASAAFYQAVEEPVAGSFIVVFKQGVSAEAIAAHKAFATNNNVQIDRHYSIGKTFKGYAAHMTKDAVGALLQADEIAYIEEDGVVRAFHEEAPKAPTCVTQTGATWGLVRTSEKLLNIDGRYLYNSDATGQGTTVYVIDTGILTTHVEFQTASGGSRAHWGYNAIDTVNTDENGHGTHCAGTIGGKTYGVAKDANLVAVKVLNKQGQGTNSAVISGINWVHNQAIQIKGGAHVASMSLGGSKSAAVNDAVAAAITDPDSPTTFALAAGNNNQDAAGVSPASTPGGICVAASDNADKKASFSNWGKTVTLYAPGVSITSAWIGATNNAVNTISGTSMATPHVAGVIAKFLQTQPKATAPEVKAWLASVATADIITNGAIGGTPNLLLFADCNNLGLGSNSTLKLHKRY